MIPEENPAKSAEIRKIWKDVPFVVLGVITIEHVAMNIIAEQSMCLAVSNVIEKITN